MSKIVRELRNHYAVIADLASGAEHWSARPAWLEFAPNNLCNLRCIMCDQADGLPLEVMDKATATVLLDEILPGMTLWTPAALSEPMLANIRLVVEKCRQHEVHLNLHSNCTLLTGAKFAAMADRIHKLWISFDSPRKEVLERLRVGVDFDTVVANMREVIAVARERGVPLGFVAVLMKDNLEHLHELVDFLADLGAADARCDLRIQPLLGDAERCRRQNVFTAFSGEAIAAALDRVCARAEARGLLLHVDMEAPYRRNVTPQAPVVREITAEVLLLLIEAVRERFPHFCSMATSYLKILPNGDVYPCCNAPRELRMGNIHEESVAAIWNGERYRAFRRRMHARDYPDFCRTCDVLTANPRFDKQSLNRTPDA